MQNLSNQALDDLAAFYGRSFDNALGNEHPPLLGRRASFAAFVAAIP
jgi:hypothetical protein